MTRFGPLLTEQGTQFRLWAPNAKSVALVLDELRPMHARGGGFMLDVPGAKAGMRYQFRIVQHRLARLALLAKWRTRPNAN